MSDLRERIAKALHDADHPGCDWFADDDWQVERFWNLADAVLAALADTLTPEPDRCPTCGSELRGVRFAGCIGTLGNPVSADPWHAVPQEAVRCPTCGSDDPKFCVMLRNIVHPHRDGCCSDPWHTPEAQR